MDKLREFPYLVIYWDAETRSVISQWRGGHTGRNIKEGLNASLEECRKKLPTSQWISDATDIGVIGLEEQEWINTEWFPAFLSTGIKFTAIVQPKSAVSKLMIEQIISKVPRTQLTIYNCVELNEARKWMKEQKV